MKSIRQKWASHKTYRRIQRSWQDYTSIIDKSDIKSIAQKLNAFLDTFDEAYHEMIQAEQEQDDMSIERLYGDCSEIMTTLFNAIERETSQRKSDRSKCMQEPINKALVLINLILKEDKYRRIVAESPDFISRLLLLLEKPGSPETKVLLLRIIATIGESDHNKIEIAKLEGYKKILRLLITENPALTQEVVRTVNHLLEFSNGHPEITNQVLLTSGLKSSASSPTISIQSKAGSIIGFNPKSLLARSSVQLNRTRTEQLSLPPRPKSLMMNRHVSRGSSPFDPPRSQTSIASIKSMASIDRVSQAISEVRGIFVQELGKIFPQLKDQDGLGILGMGSDEPGDVSIEKQFIPNAEQIRFTIAYYSQLTDQCSTSTSSSLESLVTTDSFDPPDPPPKSDKDHAMLPSSKPIAGLIPDPSKYERTSLKKMASTPDFRVASKLTFVTRRKSEDRTFYQISKATKGAAIELAQEEELLRKSQPDNVLKGFMRTQGALRSLMNILSEKNWPQRSNSSKSTQKQSTPTVTKLATKIDIMETVCRVLFQNSENQSEFISMDGFSILLNVVDEIVIPADSNQHSAESVNINGISGDLHIRRLPGEAEFGAGLESKQTGGIMANKRSLLLKSLFSVFFDLTLDGSTRDMVQNTEAFHFLFRLLLQSKQLDVRQQALCTIQDLISLNPLNAVAAWRCGEVDMVVGKLREYLCVRPTNCTLYEAQWELGRTMGLDPQSSNVRGVYFDNMSYFDGFVVSEDTAALADMIENGSAVYQYVIGITRLLEYMAVMLIQDNVYILYELSRLLMEIEFPDDSSILINIVLRCVGRIVSDMIARGIPVEEKFASIYLQIVRRMLDCQHTSSLSSFEMIDEQEQELRDSVFTEQRLLTLHILGLVLKGMGNRIDIFDILQGFETLTGTILLEKRACRHPNRPAERLANFADSISESRLCQDCYRSDIVISDLALWLFRELALQDTGNNSTISWIIVMLKTTLSGIEELRRQSELAKAQSKYGHSFLSVHLDQQQDQAHALLAYLYAKICGTVSLIFRKNSESKAAFGEAGGMQLLLSILSNTQHPDIASAALVAIGDFFAGYEGTKTLLGASFGYEGFLEIVLDSCRPLDKISCEIVLEVATVGNVMSVKSRPHVKSDNSIYCTEIWPFIANLSDPQLLLHSALPFTTPRKVGERNSFRLADKDSSILKVDKYGGLITYQTNGRGTPSRPSSVYLEENIDFASNVGVSIASTQHQAPSPKSMANSSAILNTTPFSNRYSIFGISPWPNSTPASTPITSSQEPISLTIPQVVEPTEGNGADSSRRSSVQLHRSGRSTPVSNVPDLHTNDDSVGVIGSTPHQTLQLPKEKGPVTNRKRSNSRNIGGFGLNTTNLGFQSVEPSERLAFKQLAGIVFRDEDAARMTLRLLERVISSNNPKLATDYFNLLMLLMEVTPRNKELLSRNNGLRFMLEILFRRGRRHSELGIDTSAFSFLPRVTDPPYIDLVPAMGAYDISVEDVKLLFNAVYDPLGAFFRLTSEHNHGSSNLTSGRQEQTETSDLLGSLEQNSLDKVVSNTSADAITPVRITRSQSHNLDHSTSESLQFNPLFIGEMEQQMMYAIEKISERVDPPAYFNFNGLDASLTTHPGVIEKATSAKGGYTVSVWIKVTAFLEKETGLFCYEEENGNRTVFELYFKSLDQSNRYCLCVRTQHYPSPPEDFVFDRFDFAETGIWHHIVFVHHKTMKLMVDGCVIQSYGTFNQRRQEKEVGMIGVLGRKGRNCMSGLIANSPVFNDVTSFPNSSSASLEMPQLSSASTLSLSSTNQRSLQQGTTHDSSLGHFCGQSGKVHFLQGDWDQSMAEKVYNLGPASTESWKTLDIKNTVIAVLDPEEFMRDIKAKESNVSITRDSRMALDHGILEGGCTIHMTKAMRNLIGQVGGIQLCFHFLEFNPSHLQLVGLRVISNLLYKSPENIAQFQNHLNGYEIMYDLLLNTASELSVDHFGVLFDIAINGMVKDEHLILSNIPCVQLILRLLPYTMDAVQSYILRTLVDLIVESSENMRFWRASFGMPTLFDLFRTLQGHLRPFLMWTLESMLDGMTVQELGLLIGFIGHEELDLFDVRRDIIEILFKRMTTDHTIVDLLGSGLEGVTVLIGLLDSPNEHFRILVLKMIGILLSDNTQSGKAALDKPNIGIGLIRSTLEKYPLSMDVIQVLLGLAQNSYRCDPSFRSIEKGTLASRRSAEKLPTEKRSAIAMSPISPSPPRESTNAAVNQVDFNLRASQSFKSESEVSNDDTRQGSPVLRKSVHSNSVNAPFIKMSALPKEPLIISSSNNSTSSSKGEAKITDELTYASMIRLIFELTGSLSHTDLVTHTLTDLKRLMTSENMRILWEAGWVNWVGAFMHDKSKVRVTSAAESLCYNRAMGVLDGMMQKMMIFDLSRKGSVTIRNRGNLVSRQEDVAVQLRLTEAALTWFDKNPNLDTEAANLICKGMVALFRRVEELSRKFEEKQKQAENARQQALEKERAHLAQIRAREQERERLALEAVSSALSGVLENLDTFERFDDSDSMFLKADEGDIDAEEVVVEPNGSSSGSEVAAAPQSGSISPTCSNTSTSSPPLATYYLNSQLTDRHNAGDFESRDFPSLPRQNQEGHSHNQHSNQPRSVDASYTISNSSTPPAIPDHSGNILIHSHEISGGSLLWPPLRLYEHFARCINNLACFNNSAIRAAMKSSGLFKIRDSLIDKLGKSNEGSLMIGSSQDGATNFSYGISQPQQYPHHQFIYQPGSSSSSIHHESDSNSVGESRLNSISLSYTANTTTNHPGAKNSRSRKRQSHLHGQTGLGLEMPSVI